MGRGLVTPCTCAVMHMELSLGSCGGLHLALGCIWWALVARGKAVHVGLLEHQFVPSGISLYMEAHHDDAIGMVMMARK